MSKIKINELASRIDKKSSDIIGALEALSIDNNGKRFVATSSMEEDIARKVLNKLGVSESVLNATKEKPEEGKSAHTSAASTTKAEESKSAEKSEGKKKITVVYNPQNSSHGQQTKRTKTNNQGQRMQKTGNGKQIMDQHTDGTKNTTDSIHTQREGTQNTQVQKESSDTQKEINTPKTANPTANTVKPQESTHRPQYKTQNQYQNGQRNNQNQGTNGQRGTNQNNSRYNNQNNQNNQRYGNNQNNRPNNYSNQNNRSNNQGGQRPNNANYNNTNNQRYSGNNQRNNNSNTQGQYSQHNTQNTQGNTNQHYNNTNRGSENQQRPNNRYNNQNNGQNRGNNKPQMSIPAPIIAPEKRPEKRQEKKQDTYKDKRKENFKEIPLERKKNAAESKAAVQQIKEPEIKVIIIPEVLTIKELAEKMKMQPAMLVKKLFLQGKVVTINQEIDFDTAEEIALEFDIIAEKEKKIDVIEELLKEEEEDESTMLPRPPVICVMGHVDHGKTSLLDAIRSTNVIAKEAGGITQHIGAYVVEINGQKITFLDTPGHEAFTAMRMRGAQSTDIAILVVAADDGVMPQTIEAINHAKAAGIEIIVAVNKIDKPSANIDRVKQELIEYELVAEDWGGSTIFVPVSAHTHEGIESLLEMILLTAEIKELKANPKRKARGLVIEAQLDKGKGPVATVLVQKGTLHIGDTIAAGACHGKVRAMIDDKGRRVKEAGPSTPVEILGLNDVPNAGEIFVCCENEKEARGFAETFISQGKERLLEDTKAKLSLDDLFTQIKAGNVKELNIVVKADVQGSVEAIKQSLIKLSNEEVIVKVIHGGVGAINESDVILASASNAIIIGFNVRPDNTAKGIAERENVDVRLYKVIYNAIEDVEAAMKGMLDPTFEEKVIGHAEVRQIFKASGLGTIAGSYVLDGKFQRNCSVRITRDGEQIFEGSLASLKRFKDDVKEVNAGYECGLVFEKFNDLKEGDQVEAYIMEEVPR